MGGDFCGLIQEVVFPVGVASQEVTVHLLDDSIAEGPEYFYLQLLEGVGLTKAILQRNIRSKITITDTEDCKCFSHTPYTNSTHPCHAHAVF